MTAEQKRDLRYCILRELHRAGKYGRSVRGLHTIIVTDLPGLQPEAVDAETKFLLDLHYLKALPVNELAGTDEPFYAITSKGISYCHKEHLI